jgi:hypothetical protein
VSLVETKTVVTFSTHAADKSYASVRLHFLGCGPCLYCTSNTSLDNAIRFNRKPKKYVLTKYIFQLHPASAVLWTCPLSVSLPMFHHQHLSWFQNCDLCVCEDQAPSIVTWERMLSVGLDGPRELGKTCAPPSLLGTRSFLVDTTDSSGTIPHPGGFRGLYFSVLDCSSNSHVSWIATRLSIFNTPFEPSLRDAALALGTIINVLHLKVQTLFHYWSTLC